MINRKVIRPNFKPVSKMTKSEKISYEINNSDLLVEKILNSKKIKYILLRELKEELPKNIKSLTWYIDLYSILGEVFSPNVSKELIILNRKKQLMISSNIINLAGHLRVFFAKYGIKTKFIFFYSNQMSENETAIEPLYKQSFYNKKIVGYNEESKQIIEIVNRNINLMETLSDYLPHIYFMNSGKVDPLMIPYHFIKENPSETAIIYSNDKLNIMNALLSDNVYILTFNYKEVIMYNKNDFINLYMSNKKSNDNKLTPYLIPFMFSISGYKKYDIYGLKGYGEVKTFSLIDKLVNTGILSNINYDILTFSKDISKKFNTLDIETINNNYKILNLDMMYNRLSIADKVRLDNKITDLQDIKSLVSINSEYYEKISRPIDLEAVLTNEKYESIT